MKKIWTKVSKMILMSSHFLVYHFISFCHSLMLKKDWERIPNSGRYHSSCSICWFGCSFYVWKHV